MKGYLDAKELESYKKEDLQELAKQLGDDADVLMIVPQDYEGEEAEDRKSVV